MSERSSFMFQARLGRSRSSYILPGQTQDFTASKLHLASMAQLATSPTYSSLKPAIPPRSPSRPRARNKLQKKQRPQSDVRSHLGFLIKDARNQAEEYSRGTLGGFWVLGQEAESNVRKRNSSWYFQSEPDILPLSAALKDVINVEPERPYHQRNSSSSSQESDLSDIWQTAQSSPSWDSDNTSCSSIYSSDDIERKKTPATDVGHLLSSAEILAEQYRSILASRASMRTPLPPPVPPKNNARSQQLNLKPISQPTVLDSTCQNIPRLFSINRKPVRAQTSPLSVSQIQESSQSIKRKPIKAQASSPNITQSGAPRPRTLRRVISAHSLRRMTISSHPAFSSSSGSSSGSDSGDLSDSSSSSMSTPPPGSSITSMMDNKELSHSVNSLTHQLSKALLFQDFCNTSDSMQDLNRNRKSVIQIQSLIEAYEELQEELDMGRVEASERQMVWEMNGVVGIWLSGLYRKNGA